MYLLREVIDGIFLNSELMGGFKNIDLNTYQTVDELLISYYIKQRHLNYNVKNTLRTIKIDSIDTTFYFRVIANCN